MENRDAKLSVSYLSIYRASASDCIGSLGSRSECSSCARYLECLKKTEASDLRRGF